MAYKQANGKYRAVKIINGQRRQKTCATLKEARLWEATQSAENWKEPEAAARIVTVWDWTQEYLSYAKEQFSHQTYLEKRKAFACWLQFNPGLKDLPVDELKPAHVLPGLRRRALDASGNAANKDRKNFRAAWQWGVDYLGLPEVDPFKVKRFAFDAQPRYVPSEADFWKAYAATTKEEDKLFLLVALHTAARKSELFRLRWSDLDLAATKTQLGTRKTKSGGMSYSWVSLTSVATAALAEHKKKTNSVFVFTREDGQPFTSRQHYMERLCKRASVKPFGFHAIRHLSASLMAEAGVSLTSIQLVLRHKSPTTTARYLRNLGFVENVVEDVFVKKEPRSGSTGVL